MNIKGLKIFLLHLMLNILHFYALWTSITSKTPHLIKHQHWVDVVTIAAMPAAMPTVILQLSLLLYLLLSLSYAYCYTCYK